MTFEKAREKAAQCWHHPNCGYGFSMDEFFCDIIANAIYDASQVGYDQGYDDGKEKEPDWRKIYAGQAMIAYVTNPGLSEYAAGINAEQSMEQVIAQWSFDLADKMLKESAK